MKKLIKSVISCIVASQLFVCTAFAKPDWPSDTGVQAEAGIVMDMDSGAVLFGQNIHVEYPPASITKILTALLVLENADLDETVTYSLSAVNNVEADSGNKSGVAQGDTMTVRDCLHALLLISCNQTANALAEHVAGSQEAFVQMMNNRIAEIGCTESHFDNPSGLNGETQYVSAYDMALIAREAFKNETLREIAGTMSYQLPPTTYSPESRTIVHEDKVLRESDQYYYPAAKAGKTGYLVKAGNTLVTYGEQDGRQLVSVILKGSPGQYYVDGTSLLDFGFRRFQNWRIDENETDFTSGEGPIVVGDTSYEPGDLQLEAETYITLPQDAQFSDAEKTVTVDLPENHPENAVGLVEYSYNDRAIGQAYLELTDTYLAAAGTAGEDDSQNPSESESEAASSQPETEKEETAHNGIRFFWIVLVILVVLAAAAGGFLIYTRQKEEKEKERRRQERRRRLREEEGAQAEAGFERILEERRQAGRNRRHNHTGRS